MTLMLYMINVLNHGMLEEKLVVYYIVQNFGVNIILRYPLSGMVGSSVTH